MTSRRIDVLVFDREETLLSAAEELRSHEVEILDAHSPYPVHGIDALIGIRRSRLPAVCLAAGAAGLALGLWFQYWSNGVDWPLDVGGKPFDSLPAFLVVAFELTVLFAGVATVLALLLRSRLLPGRRPRLTGVAVTDDRFALVVARRTGAFTDAALVDLRARHGAVGGLEMVEEER